MGSPSSRDGLNYHAPLRVQDVSISDDFMKVYLIKRKNDQYRDGYVSVIARSRKPTCPVGITEGNILFKLLHIHL